MATKTEAIKEFLQSTNSHLALHYNKHMEVQVNVDRGEGVKHVGKFNDRTWRGWRDPLASEDDCFGYNKIWKEIRIPVNAGTEPKFNDTKMMYSLMDHAEGIGMTGWDFNLRASKWVGFDFDSIVNHEAGIDPEEMIRVKKELEAIPWVEINSSKSGEGIHAYVYFNVPFPTANHNEHSALARSILSVMSAEVGYPFVGSVDCVGSILWVWHKDTEGTRGLKQIKANEEKFPIGKIPKNWKEHLSVTKDKKARTSINQEISELSKTVQEIRMTPEHRLMLKWLSNNAKEDFWFDNDRFMLVGHTKDFKRCHEALNLKGLFETSSSGSSEKNCFAFPDKNSTLKIYRYGKNTSEHQAWNTDKKGWTTIQFNNPPTFDQANAYFGGLMNEKGNYVFATILENGNAKYSSTDSLIKTLKTIDLDLMISEQMKNRDVITSFNCKESKISIRIVANKGDMNEIGWIKDRGYWLKVFNYCEEEIIDVSNLNIDNYVRHTISSGVDTGWYINIQDQWVSHPVSNVEIVLATLLPEYTLQERKSMVGQSILGPWKHVSVPFSPEYPGGKIWNRNGAQLAFKPERGSHPTWDAIYDHVGTNLDEAVLENQWCINNGIISGSEFLFIWTCYMFREPDQQLPYLFFFGKQDSGKSSMHEALQLLFKEGRGYCKADSALTTKFNGGLDGTVLSVVEETDLGSDKNAYNRIKENVTAKYISINAKYKDPYMTKNYNKWIQTANSETYCPIFPDDTRIIVIEVNTIENLIDKHILFERLFEEAPAFLGSIFEVKMPEKTGRLALPVLVTSVKAEIEGNNLNELESFIKDNCFAVDGCEMTAQQFYEAFRANIEMTLNREQLAKWSKFKVGRSFPRINGVCRGKRSGDGIMIIGNMTFNSEELSKNYKWVKTRGGTLKKEKISGK